MIAVSLITAIAMWYTDPIKKNRVGKTDFIIKGRNYITDNSSPSSYLLAVY